MLSAYPACFLKEETGYSVIFPDLSASTCGNTLEEALAMSIDCMAGVLYDAKKSGETVPAPSPLSSVSMDAIAKDLEVPLQEGSFVNIVTVDVDEYARTHFNRSVKKTLTIPSWLNQMAEEQGVNFSRILQNALKRELGVQ